MLCSFNYLLLSQPCKSKMNHSEREVNANDFSVQICCLLPDHRDKQNYEISFPRIIITILVDQIKCIKRILLQHVFVRADKVFS